MLEKKSLKTSNDWVLKTFKIRELVGIGQGRYRTGIGEELNLETCWRSSHSVIRLSKIGAEIVCHWITDLIVEVRSQLSPE